MNYSSSVPIRLCNYKQQIQSSREYHITEHKYSGLRFWFSFPCGLRWSTEARELVLWARVHSAGGRRSQFSCMSRVGCVAAQRSWRRHSPMDRKRESEDGESQFKKTQTSSTFVLHGDTIYNFQYKIQQISMFRWNGDSFLN